MNRSTGERFRSLALATLLALLAFVATQFEIVVSNDKSPLLLFVHENLDWLLPGTGLLIALVAGMLVVVEKRRETHRFSHRLGFLNFVLDVLIGVFSFVFGVLANIFWGNDAAPFLKPVGQIYEAHQPLSLRIIFALALLAIIIEPLGRYLWHWFNRPGTKTRLRLLKKLKSRYGRQLRNLLTRREVRSRLIIMEPGDSLVDPLPAPQNPPWNAPPLAGDETMQELYQRLIVANWRLLLLSKPGGGKSTQLYLLAYALVYELEQLERQQQDNLTPRKKKKKHQQQGNLTPIPVILDLSTYPADEPLEDWLVDALVRVYNVNRGAAHDWIDQGQILPLLDTLDSLSLAKRRRCVARINDYLATHRDWPLVVCCREDEYHQLMRSSQPMGGQNGATRSFWARITGATRRVSVATHRPAESFRLKLNKAVIYQRLTREAVHDRLTRQLEHAATNPTPSDNEIQQAEALLQDAQNDEVCETLRTPLLLSLAMMDRSEIDTPHGPIRYANEEDKRRLRMFRGYTAAAIAHSPPQNGNRASSDHEMDDDSQEQEEHHIARMEKGLGWLGDALQHANARSMQKDRNQDDPVIFYLRDIQPSWLPTARAKQVYRRWLAVISIFFRVTLGPLLGFAIAVIITAVYAIGGGRLFQPRGNLQNVVEIGAIIAGIIGGIGAGIALGGTIDAAKDIVFNIGDDRPDAPRFRSRWLLTGATTLGLATSVLLFVTEGPVFALFSTGASALVVGMILGVSRARPAADDPNDVFITSLGKAVATVLRYVVIGALVGAAVVGGVMGGGTWWAHGASEALRLLPDAVGAGALFGGPGIGFFVGFGIMLDTVGAAILQHLFLRLVLKQSRVVPFRLGSFLDEASSYSLLSRVGNGYTFVGSRELRNFFAAEYWETYAETYGLLLKTLPHHHKLTETWCPRCYRRSNWLKRLLYDAARKIKAMNDDPPRLQRRLNVTGVGATGQASP